MQIGDNFQDGLESAQIVSNIVNILLYYAEIWSPDFNGCI